MRGPTTRAVYSKPSLTEAEVKEQINGCLALDDWRVLNCEPVRNREWGKGFGEKGMPDSLYLRYLRGRYDEAEVIWIEHKRVRTGRKAATKATQAQQAWHATERARGALTLIAGEDFEASFDGFMRWYAKSGLNRKLDLKRWQT